MGVTDRRERAKLKLRGEILAAARELFAEQGYESVSMRKIADRIEYSPTAIYLHFKDKSELLASICEETFAKLTHTLERLAGANQRAGVDPVESLKQGLHAYIEFGVKHPHHYQVTFLMPAGMTEEREGGMGLRAFQCLIDAVGGCVQAGRFVSDDVEEISQALWAGIHGVVTLLNVCAGFPFVSRKRLSNRVINSMVDGLLRKG